MDDREIIGLYLARQETAITETAAKYGTRLRALAKNLLRDAECGAECENDTYYAAWNAIPPHEPYDYFYAFLARITRHLALDECRKQNRAKRGAAEELTDELAACIPAGMTTEEEYDKKALSDVLDGFLAGLSREERTVFLRRYFFGDGIQEIAERGSMSESRVKSMLFRLRARLKNRLEKHEEE